MTCVERTAAATTTSVFTLGRTSLSRQFRRVLLYLSLHARLDHCAHLDNSGEFCCDVCGKDCSSHNYLSLHARQDHCAYLDNSGEFYCDVCGKDCSSSNYLSLHTRLDHCAHLDNSGYFRSIHPRLIRTVHCEIQLDVDSKSQDLACVFLSIVLLKEPSKVVNLLIAILTHKGIGLLGLAERLPS